MARSNKMSQLNRRRKRAKTLEQFYGATRDQLEAALASRGI